MDRHRKTDEYHSQFLGGRNCTRITIPILTLDQIRLAAILLKQLGEDLEACAADDGSMLGKILEARSLCGAVSRKLKGGVAFKGAR